MLKKKRKSKMVNSEYKHPTKIIKQIPAKHKNNEVPLEKIERRVSSIIDHTLVGVFQSGTGGKVFFMNKSLLKMLEYESVQDINARGGAVILYKDPKKRDEIVSLIKKEHYLENYEIEFISKTGKQIFTYLCMRLEGDILSGTIVDITKLKTAENQIKKSKKYLEMLLMLNPTAVYTVDLEKRITRWNNRAREITGYSAEEAIGKKCTLFMSSPCKDKCGLYSVDVKKPVICKECTLIRKDGQTRIVLKSADYLIDENGNNVGGIESFEDITEYKRIVEELENSEERFRNTFEQAVVGISHVGLDGKWIFINRKYCDILGYTHDELKKKTFKEITYPEDIKIDYQNFLRMINNEIDTYQREKRYIRKDGLTVWVDLTVYTIRDTSGKVKYLVAVIVDINERKKVETELQRNTKRTNYLLGLSRLRDHSIKEISNYVLESSIDLTESKVGFFHFYDELKKEITLHTWSKDVLPECSLNQDQHYPLEKAGIWADCIRSRKPVIFNDYQNEPNKKGYPEGHFPVKSFMCVPIFGQDKIVMICGTGNKPQPYDQSNADDLTVFLSSAWAVIKELQAEEKLRDSEYRIRELFDNMDSCVAVYETRGNGDDFIFKGFNKSAENTDRIKKEDLLGKSVLDVFPGVKKFGLFKVFKEVWKTGIPQSHPIAFYKDKRISGWRENFVYKLPAGEIVTIYNDITEKKQAEEKLNILSGLPRENPNPVLRISEKGEILYKNPATLKLLRKIKLSEKDIFHILPKNIVSVINKALKTKTTISDLEVVIGNKIYLYTLSPMTGQKYANLYGADITERKKIEAMKESAFREVSHELKTPIAMIKMAHNINEQALKNNDMNQIIKTQDIIANNIRRLSGDVNNILAMFVLKRKKELNKTNFLVKKIIEEILTNNQYLLYEKKLRVKTNIPKKVENIFADPQEIKILLNNIIGNAIKFTDKGFITISVELRGKFVTIAVKDTGYGISREIRENIFTRFYKRHPAVPGTGLGLTISKEIVEMHNGKMEVLSKGEGKGTTVTVYLPVED